MAAARHARNEEIVLVVDDEQDTREMLAEVLRAEGYVALTASNGQDALELLTVLRPSLVLLDVEMPVMDGAELRMQMRRDRRLLAIPTIVLTGRASEPFLDGAIKLVLRKPVGRPQLLAAVASAIEPRE